MAPRLIAALLLRCRVSPNALTVAGTSGTAFGAVVFLARGYLIAAVVVVGASSVCDMLDGEMARLSGRVSRFGALLDSTMDRVSDAAIFAGLAYWLFTSGRTRVAVLALACLVVAQLISYVRARAEGLGVGGEVGIAHRPLRLIVVGVGVTCAGFGLMWALELTLWVLAALGIVTIAQRMAHARRQLDDTEGA